MTGSVLLNNVDHHDVRVAPAYGPQFGDAVNQALVFPTEFEELQREYPIFFRPGEDGALQPVALLGLDRDENLFLDGGLWAARYVPAMHRRGPFSIAVHAGGERAEPMIHVDLDDPRVGRSEGHPLFLRHGGNAPFLEEIAGVLMTIYRGHARTAPMVDAFASLGLVEPVEVEIALDEGTSYTLPGYSTVSAERFAALGGAELEHLHRAGFLGAALFVLSSLANVHDLIGRKNRRRSGQ